MCLPVFSRSLSKSLLVGSLVFSAFGANAAGLLSPVSANLPDLTIKEHHVEVTIQDGYAITEVEQVFANPNNQALDAIYSFPVPDKAAVGEFTYWINNQPVTGEVVAKQQARQIYEEEKKAGRKTALVE
ncbi:VIT domain-containing protein, partial [Pontibacterium sp.]